MKRRKMIAMVLSLLLVMGAVLAVVSPAYAASSKTVYVLKTVKQNGYKMNTYSYDSKGRLKKGSLMYGSSECELTYNSKNRLTKFRRSFNEWCNFDYTYSSKGRVTKVNNYYTFTSDNKYAYDGLQSKLKYNSKGKVYKEIVTDGRKTYTNKFTYNSKGLLTKAVIKYPQRKGTYKYTYDGKKNVKKVVFTTGTDGSETQTYDNEYDSKGRLKKRTITFSSDAGDENTVTYTYSYKKMTVSSKYAKMIKAQQWLLLNEGLNSHINLNFSIPRNDYNAM